MNKEGALLKNEAAETEIEERGPDSQIRPISPDVQILRSGNPEQINKLFDERQADFLAALDSEWDNVPEAVKHDSVAGEEAKRSEDEARRQAAEARALAEAQMKKALGMDKAFDKFEYSKIVAEEEMKKEAKAKAEEMRKAQEALEALGPIAAQELPSDAKEQLVAVKSEQPHGFVGYEPAQKDEFEIIATPADEATAKRLQPKIEHEFVTAEAPESKVAAQQLPRFEISSPAMLAQSLEGKKKLLDEIKQKPEPERTEVNKEEMAFLSHEIAREEKKLEKIKVADELAEQQKESDGLSAKIESILNGADQNAEDVARAREALNQAATPEAKQKAEQDLRFALVNALPLIEQRKIRDLQAEQGVLQGEMESKRSKLHEIGAVLVSLDLLLAQSRNVLDQRKREQAERDQEAAEQAEKTKQEEAAEAIRRQDVELQDIALSGEEAHARRKQEKAEKRKEFVRTAYHAGGKGLKGVAIAGGAALALGLFSVSKVLGLTEKFAGWMDKKFEYMFNRSFADKMSDLWGFLTFANEKPEAPKKPSAESAE